MSALVRRRPPTEPAVVDGQEFRSDYADRFVVEPVDGRPADVVEPAGARGEACGGLDLHDRRAAIAVLAEQPEGLGDDAITRRGRQGGA